MKANLKWLLKAGVLICAALLSFNIYAWDNGYIGNPNRPYTLWVPGHYERGHWVEGYYVKFLKEGWYCYHRMAWVKWHGKHHRYYHNYHHRYVSMHHMYYTRPVVVVGYLNTF